MPLHISIFLHSSFKCQYKQEQWNEFSLPAIHLDKDLQIKLFFLMYQMTIYYDPHDLFICLKLHI